MRYFAIAIVAATLAGGAAVADEVALVMGSARYDERRDLSGGDAVVTSARALDAAGVGVVSARNATSDELFRALASFEQMAPSADALMVVLSGRFATAGGETWFLPTDNDPASLATMAREALPLSSLMTVLATVPGRAVMVLGRDADDDAGELGRYVDAGIGDIEAPQGVTVVTGPPRAIATFVQDTLSVPGASIARGVSGGRGLSSDGYVGPDVAFLRADRSNRGRRPAVAGSGVYADTADDFRYAEARRRDTAEAYIAYLGEFPRGRHASEARERLALTRAEPFQAQRQTEERLSLPRAARRAVQRDLNALGYDTRGVDGLFGAGSRQAIQRWQAAEGYESSGYLDRDQIARLEVQAARAATARDTAARAAADSAQTSVAAADADYWERSGARGGVTGLRAYLDRYPTGRFAQIARARLDDAIAQGRAEEGAPERAAWDKARRGDTPALYEAYLRQFADGVYAPDARARLEQLR